MEQTENIREDPRFTALMQAAQTGDRDAYRLADAARRYARSQARETQVENLAVTFSDESAKFIKEAYGDPESLRLALESLPAGQRNAIEMLKLREMSLKEAADASGTSVGALKIATHRAMNALRRKLMNKKR